MDRGGRFLRPLTAGATGGADGRVASFVEALPRLGLIRLPAFLRFRKGRRRSVAVPLERKLPRFLGTGLTFLFFGVVGVTGAALGGHLQTLRVNYGEPHHMLARMLGLGLDRVTIAGIAQLTEAEILDAAGISPRISLAFLNAAEVRERLEAVPLIKSVTVRKLYPDELILTLSERDPHGLWQRNGEVFVIAADGTVIDFMHDARFAHLPLVVGEGANRRGPEYLALLEAAGSLKSRIKAGTLVSGRRWTLKLDNGMDVRLPEIGALAAMARLVKLEREQKILDKDVIAIDLRMKDRVVVRLTEEAMAARLDALKKKPVRGRGVET
jgi:cell division protein FtsQ